MVRWFSAELGHLFDWCGHNGFCNVPEELEQQQQKNQKKQSLVATELVSFKPRVLAPY